MNKLFNNEIEETSNAKSSLYEIKKEKSEENFDQTTLTDAPQEKGKEQFEVETSIDDKVTEIDKKELPDNIVNSFQSGEYKTVVTNEPITVYRVFGIDGDSKSDGCFTTTEKPFDALSAKTDTALIQEYKNSKQFYEEITIPEGTEINIGKVGERYTPNSQKLEGGKEQVLLPEKWDKSWASDAQELKARPFAELAQAEKDIHESNN